MTRSVHEAASGAEGIAGTIKGVATSAHQVSEGSAAALAAAQEVSQTAEGLQALVGGYRY